MEMRNLKSAGESLGAAKNRVQRGDFVIGLLIALSLFVLLFSNGDSGTAFQVFSIAVLGVAAVAAGYLKGIARVGPSPIELLILAMCMLSAVVCLNTQAEFVFGFTIAMLVSTLIGAIIARSVPPALIVAAAANAFLAMTAVILVFYPKEMAAVLNTRSDNRWMLRIRPFGMHPNLVGFAFAGGAILLLCKSMTASLLMRIVYAAASVTSILIVIAASARAGLLAFGVSGTVVLLALLPRLPNRVRVVVVAFVSAGALATLAFFSTVWQFLTVVLELESDTRGLRSGGSGRSTTWAKGLELIQSSAGQLLFGTGLRSASVENIGFHTENSFITIVLESGLIAGGLLICLYVFYTVRAARSVSATDANDLWGQICFFWVLLYAIVESFFNRYLFAIGNPLSLFVLMVVFVLASRGGSTRAGR